MSTLFFDTETTGLNVKGKPDTHPCQPMPVQLGVKVDSPDLREMNALNMLIQTNTTSLPAWQVHPKAFETTGINNEIADRYGVHLISAMEVFLDMMDTCEDVVAHNIAYDIIVMRRAMKVYCDETGQDYRDPFEGKRLICTMKASQDLVKALPKRNGQWKWPKLEEAMKHFFNEGLEGAHDALVDVRGCARVYYHLHKIGAFNDEFTQQL